MAKDEYDPEIQSVIDRFIRGDISLRTKATRDPAKDQRNLPKKSQADWADSHEEAKAKIAGKKSKDGNYYERLANRGHDRTGDDDGADSDSGKPG